MKYPIKIKVFLEGGFKLNIDATCFTILSLNKIQELFEFEIHQINQKFIKRRNQYASVHDFSNFVKKSNLLEKNTLYVCITKQSILNNWFHVTIKPYSVITLSDWKKSYSPPSYIEYIINSLTDCILHSIADLDSHDETKGCCLDYTKNKKQLKWGIPLGHICLDCKDKIIKKTDNNFLDAISNMVSLEWMGNPKEFNSVAYKLKKYYRFNIDKDTGLEKSWLRKVWDDLTSLPRVLIAGAIIAIISYLLGRFAPP